MILFNVIHEYRSLFEVYPNVNSHFGQNLKTPERFEICNELLYKSTPISVNAMFAHQFVTKDSREAALKLMKHAVDYFKSVVENSNKTKWSLDSLELYAGYPNDMIDDSFLNQIYGNLKLNGNETLLESFQELIRHQKFIKLQTLSQDEFKTLEVGSQTPNLIGEKIYNCKLTDDRFLCKFSL